LDVGAEGYNGYTISQFIAVELTDMDSDELCERSRLLRRKADEVIAWARENARWAEDVRERARRNRTGTGEDGVVIDAVAEGCPSDSPHTEAVEPTCL
jgi:hypothetical protein